MYNFQSDFLNQKTFKMIYRLICDIWWKQLILLEKCSASSIFLLGYKKEASNQGYELKVYPMKQNG